MFFQYLNYSKLIKLLKKQKNVTGKQADRPKEKWDPNFI